MAIACLASFANSLKTSEVTVFASCGWTPTVAQIPRCLPARRTASRLDRRSAPTVITPIDASKQRAITAARSLSKARSSR